MTGIDIQKKPEILPPRNIPDEWETTQLDIDAYRRRIGYDGPLAPTKETLFSLHRAHAERIPFENLDIPLGRGISLVMNDMQNKILRQERGGYCYEHNLLFAALLECAGFTVRRLVARVQPDKPGNRTHMTLNVLLDGQVWLADVGFGAALLEPIPLIDGAVSRQGDWTNGVVQRDDGTWRLRTQGQNSWVDLYAFTQEPQHLNDYVMYNHFVSTHPRSPFSRHPVAIRITPTTRFTLRDGELTVAWPNGTAEHHHIPERDIPEILHSTFGIHLNPEDVMRLQESNT